MVKIPRLLAAAETLVWRHGLVTGGSVKHQVEADGAHVITIVVPPILVDPDSLPKKPEPTGKLSWGMVTPDISKPGR